MSCKPSVEYFEICYSDAKEGKSSRQLRSDGSKSVTKVLTVSYLPATEEKSPITSVIAAENVSIVFDKLYLHRSIEVPIKLKARVSVDLESMAGFIDPMDTLGGQNRFK